MTKQFTIPCQFGQQTSPVTFYIGHPDNGHHPIHFQSNWLSSAKGGTVPQDLMMTLQKLHDLALENNADFEELCYYALISATQNSNGDGVSEGEITSYADEYLKKELNGEVGNEEQKNEPINNADGGENNNIEGVVREENNANNNQQSSVVSNKNISNNTDIDVEKQKQDNVEIENHNDKKQSQTNNIVASNTINKNTANKAKVVPSLNTTAKKTEEVGADNNHQEIADEDLLEADLFYDSQTEANTQSPTISHMNSGSEANTDDDILMDDDLLSDDTIFNNDNIEIENSINDNGLNQKTQHQEDIDNEYDDLLDDDIIFDDDSDNELLDEFTNTSNNDNNANATKDDEGNLFMDDDLMDFGK